MLCNRLRSTRPPPLPARANTAQALRTGEGAKKPFIPLLCGPTIIRFLIHFRLLNLRACSLAWLHRPRVRHRRQWSLNHPLCLTNSATDKADILLNPINDVLNRHFASDGIPQIFHSVFQKAHFSLGHSILLIMGRCCNHRPSCVAPRASNPLGQVGFHPENIKSTLDICATPGGGRA